ncbi:eotaxin-like [Lates japonicus]
MRSSLGLACLLCFITWMSLVHATHGPMSSCLCVRLSNTKVQVKRIVNYTIQSDGICPMKAVVFQTQSGKRLCSDPHSNWAKRAMKKVDEETKVQLNVEQNEEGSASGITTTTSITPKMHHGSTAGQERGSGGGNPGQ